MILSKESASGIPKGHDEPEFVDSAAPDFSVFIESREIWAGLRYVKERTILTTLAETRDVEYAEVRLSKTLRNTLGQRKAM